MHTDSLIEKLEAEIARFPESEALPYKNGLRKAIAIVREHKQTRGAAAPYPEKDPIEDGYWPKKSKTAEPCNFPTGSVDSWRLCKSQKLPEANERNIVMAYSAAQCLEPISDRDWDGKWRIKKALAFLSLVGYTPAPEPVSVDIEAAREAILRIECEAMRDGKTGASAVDIAKECASAWGLKWK